MNQQLSTETPAKTAEVQVLGPTCIISKDLESEDGLIRGQWAVGFWDCFTDLMPNCFMATCYSCISMAQISARVGVASYLKAIACLVIVIAEFVVSRIALSAASSSVTVETNVTNDRTAYIYSASDNNAGVVVYRAVMILVCSLRDAQTRERFQILASLATTVFLSLCCSCCTFAQMATPHQELQAPQLRLRPRGGHTASLLGRKGLAFHFNLLL